LKVHKKAKIQNNNDDNREWLKLLKEYLDANGRIAGCLKRWPIRTNEVLEGLSTLKMQDFAN
jgi:hypothetical protein